MASTSFKDMSKTQREQWLKSQQDSGQVVRGGVPTLIDRVRRALRHYGPMTTSELAERSQTTTRALTNWGYQKRDLITDAGVHRHYSPDDGRAYVWFLDESINSNVNDKLEEEIPQAEDEETASPVANEILARLRSSVGTR